VGNEPVIKTILETMNLVSGSPKATDYFNANTQPATH
jgi:hypothetical protein